MKRFDTTIYVSIKLLSTNVNLQNKVAITASATDDIIPLAETLLNDTADNYNLPPETLYYEIFLALS